jgi:phage-related holin
MGEFFSSTFGFFIKKNVFLLSITLGCVAEFTHDMLGLDPYVYSAFVLLIALEFITGIKASLKEGKKIQSKRFGRVILKLGVYTMMIGILNIFSTRLYVPELFGQRINIYAIIYFTMLNLLTSQLILSLLENLSRLGFEETSKIYKAIAKILKKYFDLGSDEDS